jgi:hypothetical protein
VGRAGPGESSKIYFRLNPAPIVEMFGRNVVRAV